MVRPEKGAIRVVLTSKVVEKPRSEQGIQWICGRR